MISSEYKERIGIITLNRIEKKNALNDEMVKRLIKEIEQFNENEECRAIWFRANGDAFSAGADLSYLEKLRNNSLEDNLKDSLELGNLFYSIYTSPKITISEVTGFALAGGCGLATICDYTFASDAAKFGYTESKIGFVPALVSIFLLKKINLNYALDLMLSGKIISSNEALKIGLITNLLTNDIDTETQIEEFLNKLINTTSQNSIRMIKEMRDFLTFDGQLWSYIEYAAKKNAEARGSLDCIKGIDAFLNKQKIQW